MKKLLILACVIGIGTLASARADQSDELRYKIADLRTQSVKVDLSYEDAVSKYDTDRANVLQSEVIRTEHELIISQDALIQKLVKAKLAKDGALRSMQAKLQSDYRAEQVRVDDLKRDLEENRMDILDVKKQLVSPMADADKKRLSKELAADQKQVQTDLWQIYHGQFGVDVDQAALIYKLENDPSPADWIDDKLAELRKSLNSPSVDQKEVADRYAKAEAAFIGIAPSLMVVPRTANSADQ